MTAILLPNGKQQFIDINGKPLVGGTVGMYVPNTLIALTTWQDAGQTILNTNPIILDSRGQALIYGVATYRQIVKDALGNLIWDAITTVPTTLGATDIRAYGCVGDGITDNTAALNRAMAVGGQLLIPENNVFAFSGAVNSTVAGTQLIGQGSTSVLLPTNGSTAQINVKTSNFSAKNFNYGTSVAGSASAGFLISGSGTITGFVFEDINFVSAFNGSDNAIYLFNCSNVWVNRCTFYQYTNCIIQAPATTTSYVKITNCIDSLDLGTFVNINADSGGIAHDILIEGNTFTSSGGFPTPATEQRFVALVNAKNVQIKNNFVQDVAGESAVHVEQTSEFITISGNTFIDCIPSNGNDGWIYLLTGFAHCIISDNWFIITNAAAAGYCVSTASSAYDIFLNFTGNQIFDAANLLGGLNLAGFGANGTPSSAVIANNNMIGGTAFIRLFNTYSVSIVGNNISDGTQNGIVSDVAASMTAHAGQDIEIKSNSFNVGGYAVHGFANAASAHGPVNWTIVGNKVLGSGTGVLITDGTDCFSASNWWSSGLGNHTAGTGADNKNWLQGTGFVP